MTGPPFPVGRLDTRVEMAFGATGAPTTWQWTDVTDRLLAQSLQLQRGAPDEAGSIQPASVALTLDNLDGHLMPGGSAMPLATTAGPVLHTTAGDPITVWREPILAQGTPLRISVDGDLPALVLDGSPGAFASTPHAAALNVAGDLDLRMLVQPDMWAPGVEWANTGGRILLGNTMRLASKWDAAGDQRGWIWHHFGAGWPAIEWTSLGTGVSVVIDGAPNLYAFLQPTWLALTVDIDNGSGQTLVSYRFWDATDSPPSNVSQWGVLHESVRSGTTTIHPSTAPLRVGGIAAGLPTMRGRVLRFELRDGINGTVVANPNFSAQPPGTTSFTDGAGRTWTLNGTAAISTRRHRFVGEVVSIEPTWPHGDNHPTTSGTRPSESWVHITAADVVRRLRQGAQPLRSPLRRHVTSARFASKVTAYWPCEDERDAVQLGSALPSGLPLAITGTVELATANTLPASDALPAVAAGESCTLTSTIAGGPTSRWAVEWVTRFGAPGTTTNLLRWLCAASAATEWRVQLVTGTPDLRLQVLNGGGSVLATNISGFAAYVGKWLLIRVDARQSGSAVDWELRVLDIEQGGGFSTSGTIAGTTLDRVSSINSPMTGTADGLTVGHIIVHDGLLPASSPGVTSWLAGVDTGWIAETAAHRIWRLCTEEGVPCEIVGDGTVWQQIRGDIDKSEPMGPQARKPLLDLIAEAAALDMGVLTVRRSAPGLIYRTGAGLYNQLARLQLNGALNQITRPLVGRLDDQGLLNDVTVRSVDGSSARAVDAASVAAVGRYAADVELNAVGGLKLQAAILSGTSGLASAVADQLADQAARRLLLGTVTSLRWPTVTIDLSVAPELIGAVLNLEPGDRVTLTGLPVQAPAGVIELQVRNIVDRMTPTRWLVELTAVPGSPWIT